MIASTSPLITCHPVSGDDPANPSSICTTNVATPSHPPPTDFFLEKAILAPPLGDKINILDVCFVWVPSDSVLLKSFVGLKVSDLHCLLLQYCDGEK